MFGLGDNFLSATFACFATLIDCKVGEIWLKLNQLGQLSFNLQT